MDEPGDGAVNPPEIARAEEMVDQAAQALSGWIARASHGLLKTAARAREEAEDIWAEAQHLAEQQTD